MSLYDEVNKLWHPVDQQVSTSAKNWTGQYILNKLSSYGHKVAQVTWLALKWNQFKFPSSKKWLDIPVDQWRNWIQADLPWNSIVCHSCCAEFAEAWIQDPWCIWFFDRSQWLSDPDICYIRVFVMSNGTVASHAVQRWNHTIFLDSKANGCILRCLCMWSIEWSLEGAAVWCESVHIWWTRRWLWTGRELIRWDRWRRWFCVSLVWVHCC